MSALESFDIRTRGGAGPAKTFEVIPGGRLPLARRAAGLIGSPIDASTSLLARQTHDVVSFAMGSPGAEMLPDLGEFARDAVSPDGLGYAASEGDPPLLEAIGAMLADWGEPCDPERLLVTAGGMQGLDLACNLFLDPGDLVAVESPTYTNGMATAISYGGEILEVPVDADGMVVEALPELAARAGRTPKLIYVIPNFQNPSGVTLSRQRRLRLLELAERWDAVILDDDPYGPLRFGGTPVPGFPELSGHGPRVVSVRTFSKLIAPGLRVGWVQADPRAIELMVAAKQAKDTCANLPAQRLVAQFLEAGRLESHLIHARNLCAERQLVMDAALAGHLGDLCEWTDPDGGYFLWLRLPAGLDAERLSVQALAAGVAVIPGPAFSASGGLRDRLRLCFASTSPQRICVGISRLAAVIRAELGAVRS
jgi:2-aminoadipate transaminase